MLKTTGLVLSALSMGLGVSYWERIGADWNLRGASSSSSVVTKVESQSEVSSMAHDVDPVTLLQDDTDVDKLRAYNLSPYERHWPQYRLDPWMHKQIDTIPSKDKEVCLVHVGKVRRL